MHLPPACKLPLYFSLLTLALIASENLQAARILHVDAAKGNDESDGLSPTAAFRSIQRAADLVTPGDEVVIHPGIYHGPLTFKRGGKVDAPIRIHADRIAKNRVVLTGADPAIRRKDTAWRLEDEKLGLYSAPYSGATPNRILYSETDLYPYASLDRLKTFTTDLAPGPNHGYFHDAAAQKLYVRLHASGRHGPASPTAHTMAVGLRDGFVITLLGNRPAYIVIEGLTFETPGDAAIYTEASCVTIRDCWFFGTPYAVRGTNKGRAQAPGAGAFDTASEIVIEHCEYTEGSSFEDACELLRARQEKSPGQKAEWTDLWHRKTTGKYGLPADKNNYETGLAVRMGRGWRISHNFIHDCFEGLANDGMNLSFDTQIHHNVFARICDNAIETESHARDVRIFKNVFLDVLEPFSWQPLDSPPWPGPIWFYQNIVANTPDNAALWGSPPNEARGVFKMGISTKNWHDGKSAAISRTELAAPEPGLLFFNNTIYYPGGRLLTLLGSRDVPIRNVTFSNNLIAVDWIASRSSETDLKAGHFQFHNNRIAIAGGNSAAASQVAGKGGLVVSDAKSLGWADPASLTFTPTITADITPEFQVKIPGPDAPSLSAFGALQPGDDWYPSHPGPRVSKQP